MKECLKKPYLTKSEAKKAKKRNENIYWRKFSVYKCTLCSFKCFHLSSSRVNVDDKIFFRDKFTYTPKNSNKFD